MVICLFFEQKVFELAGQRRRPWGIKPPQHHDSYPYQYSTGCPHSFPFRTTASRRRKENMRRPLQPGYGCLRYWLTCAADGMNTRQDLRWIRNSGQLVLRRSWVQLRTNDCNHVCEVVNASLSTVVEGSG